MFRSLEDNFQVMFQSQPDIQEQGIFRALTTKLFCEKTASNYCQVGRTRVTDYFGTPDEFLDDALDILIRDISDAVLIAARHRQQGGLPTLGFQFQAGALAGQGVMLLDGKTLFTVVATGQPSAADERDAFLESFSLIQRQADSHREGNER